MPPLPPGHVAALRGDRERAGAEQREVLGAHRGLGPRALAEAHVGAPGGEQRVAVVEQRDAVDGAAVG